MTIPDARTRRRPEADRRRDDRFNDAFHTILREAAEMREDRQHAHSLEEAAAERQASIDLLSLARASRGDL
jgi:hypothetical protein